MRLARPRTVGEEIAGGLVGQRGDRLAGEGLEQGLALRHAVGIDRPGAAREPARQLEEDAGHEEIIGGPHIHQPAFDGAAAARTGRGLRNSGHHARHAHATRQGLHDEIGIEPARADRLVAARETVGMDVGDMAQIEQIVVDQPSRRLIIEPARLDRIIGRLIADEIGDQAFIGGIAIAHPQPDRAVAFDHRIGFHPCAIGDQLLSRNLEAAAVGREQQAVIHAAQVGAFAPAKRKRCHAMDAAILERDDPAVVGPVEDDRRVQDGFVPGRAGSEIAVPSGHVPRILQIHGHSLQFAAIASGEAAETPSPATISKRSGHPRGRFVRSRRR